MRLALLRLSGLGNVVFTLGIAESWKQQYPKGEVWLFTHKDYLPLERACRALDRVVPLYRLSRKRGQLHLGKWLFLLLKSHSLARQETWDVIADLQGFLENTLWTLLVPAKKKLGYLHHLSQAFAYTHHCLYRERKKEEHQLSHFLRLFKKAGFDLPYCSPRLLKREGEKCYLGVHLGASHSAKAYPLSYWKELLSLLSSLPLPVVLLLGPQELRALPRIPASFPCFIPKDLSQTLSFLSRCRLFLGVDSGPLHLASALGVPSLGLFPASKLPRYAPLGEKVQLLVAPKHLGEISPKTIYTTLCQEEIFE